MKSERYLRYQSIFSDIMVFVVLTAITREITLVLMNIANVDIESAKKEGSIYFVWWNSVLFALLLNKDILYGRSLCKIISGTYVHCNVTGRIAEPMRCLIRNLFLLLLPIEIFTLLLWPKRRLGDIVAGTEVRLYADDVEGAPFNMTLVAAALIATCLVLFGVLEVIFLAGLHL